MSIGTFHPSDVETKGLIQRRLTPRSSVAEQAPGAWLLGKYSLSMKPENLSTKIFLDGGDSAETKEIINLLGFLDGQTTNPTLLVKNPYAKERFERGEKFTREELFSFYRRVIEDASKLIPNGSVSVEVYADRSTTIEEIIRQAREMFQWISNAHIKLPVTAVGLKAAEQLIKEGMRLNLTLCFSQEQAAAVYAATRGAKKGDIFLSPFVGRLDDQKQNGMELIKNILKMYQKGDGHVEILTASVRGLDHFLYALQLKSDIITAPGQILKEWLEKGMPIPDNNYSYQAPGLSPLPYQELDLEKGWQEFNFFHELTEKGIERFSQDWNNLIK